MIILNISNPHWSSFRRTAFFISYLRFEVLIMGMGIDGEVV
jgi:hypothetical protein